MKIKVLYLLLSVLTFLAYPLISQADVWSTYRDIEQINIGGNGLHGTFVQFSGYSFPSCNSQHAYLDGDANPNYKELVSALLAAKMANSQVNINTDGCGGNGDNYALIKEISIH